MPQKGEPTTLPAAASASFQTLRFSPATSQVTARASSVSPATYSTEDALLQKPTVHHKTSCNRRRVVTSQAESPSVHGGVWEIFLSPSVPGQRTWDWHRSLLMKENREKHQKLSKDMKLGRNVARTFLDYYKLSNLIKDNRPLHIQSSEGGSPTANSTAAKAMSVGRDTTDRRKEANQNARH